MRIDSYVGHWTEAMHVLTCRWRGVQDQHQQKEQPDDGSLWQMEGGRVSVHITMTTDVVGRGVKPDRRDGRNLPHIPIYGLQG